MPWVINSQPTSNSQMTLLSMLCNVNHSVRLSKSYLKKWSFPHLANATSEGADAFPGFDNFQM